MPALIASSLLAPVFLALAAAQEDPGGAPPVPPPPPAAAQPDAPPAGDTKTETKTETKEEKPNEAEHKEDKKEEANEKEAEKREEKGEKEEKKEGAAGEGKESGEGEEEEEGPWGASVDFVLGFDTTDVGVASATTTTSGSAVPLGTTLQSSRITTGSMILGLERELGKRFEVGARIPLLYGSIDPRTNAALDNDSRGLATIGNLELEGVYKILESKGFALDASLGLALPTGGGSEQPSAKDIAANPTVERDYGSLDRGAIMRATERARGSYESALFEPDRLGFVPHVAARINAGPVLIRPGAKIEALVDTTGDAEVGTIAEFVGNINISVMAGKLIEPGVNVWTNLTLTKHEERHADLMAANPYVRFRVGNITPEVSAIVPFFGVVADEKAFGLKLAASARF